MKSIIAVIFICLAGFWIAAGCSNSQSTPADTLHDAEEAFAHRQFSKAQHILSSLADSPDFNAMSVDELCRMSLLCMRLGEAQPDSDEADIALAARVYITALRRNSDSAVAFINAVDIDDRGRAAILRALAAANHPDSLAFVVDEYTDSIP